MRQILVAFAILLLTLAGEAQPLNLYGNYSSDSGAPRTNVTMTLIRVAPRNLPATSSDFLQTVTDTNGNFEFTTTLPAALYSLSAGDSTGTRWPIATWLGSPGSNTIWNLLDWNAVIPSNSQTNYFNKAQTLALFSQFSTNINGVAIAPENFGAVVYPTLPAAMAGIDDTIPLQNALNFASLTSGKVVEAQGGYMKTTSPLVVNGACGLFGAGANQVGASFTTNGNQAVINFPSVYPYLQGTVIVNSNSTDILQVTNVGGRFDLQDIALMWNTNCAFTVGNGVYCCPSPIGTNYDVGIQNSYWRNVMVWGAGSNNYCFYQMNGEMNRYEHLQGTGGGGFEFDQDGYSGNLTLGFNPGNWTASESIFFVICNGTAKGIYLHNINSGNGTAVNNSDCILMTRCQVNEMPPTPLNLNPPPTFNYNNADNSILVDYPIEAEIDDLTCEDLGGVGGPAINNSRATVWVNPHIYNAGFPLTNMWSHIQWVNYNAEYCPSFFGDGITFGQHAATIGGVQPEMLWEDWADASSGGPYLSWTMFAGNTLEFASTPNMAANGVSFGYQSAAAGGALTGSYTPTVNINEATGTVTATNFVGSGAGLTGVLYATTATNLIAGALLTNVTASGTFNGTVVGAINSTGGGNVIDDSNAGSQFVRGTLSSGGFFSAASSSIATNGTLTASNIVATGTISGIVAGTGTYAAEQYGISTNNTDLQNSAILNTLLAYCHTNGGGVVTLQTPGSYPMFPDLVVWPYTKIILGPQTKIQMLGQYNGYLFGVSYQKYLNVAPGTNGYIASTTGAANVVTLAQTNAAGSQALNLPAYFTNAVFVVDAGTNGSGYVYGSQQTNWLAGCYIITNIVGNQIYLNRNVSSAAATNLQGCIAFALFRDGIYDSCPATNWGIPQITNSAYCSTNITIQGGIIDGGIGNQTNSINGYYAHGMWFRQCEGLVIHDTTIQNFPIYTTMIEDVQDGIFDHNTFWTQRDGFHCCGPLRNSQISRTSGKCTDNELAFGAQYTASYPIDGQPQVSFYGSGAYGNKITDTTTYGGYNPIRVVGTASSSAIGNVFDGVYGYVGNFTSSGGPVFTFEDDSGLAGMVMSGNVVRNVYCTPNTGSNNAYAAVYVQSSGVTDMTIDNVNVSGNYCGVYAVGTAGLQTTFKISNVGMPAGVSNHGDNNLVYVSMGYATGDFASISKVNDTTSVAPPVDATSYYTNAICVSVTSGGNQTINLSECNLYDEGIYLTSSGNPHYFLSNCQLDGFQGLISFASTGNSPTANFSGVYLGTANPITLSGISSGYVTLTGSIQYGNPNNAIIGTTKAHVNGNIEIYPGNDSSPNTGDIILNGNVSGQPPYIYTGSSASGNWSGFVPLYLPGIAATFNSAYIPTNTTGNHGESGYMTNGVFIPTGTY